MTTDDLTAALRACAAGLYPLEAGVALLAGNGTFLHRDDFTSRFITVGTSISDGTTLIGRHRLGRRDRCPARRNCPAPAENGVSSSCRPASPAASRSTSATPLPASTTATSPGWLPPFTTRPGNDQRTADIDDCL